MEKISFSQFSSNIRHIITIVLIFSTITIQAAPHFPWSDIFEDYGISNEVSTKVLSVSGGDPFYDDSTRCGLWALNAPIAVRYGLYINRSIDERFDPQKASIAAAHYMSDLISFHRGDTSLAITAFVYGAAVCADSLAINHQLPQLPHFTYSAVPPTLDSIYNHSVGYNVDILHPIRITTLTDSLNIPLRTFRLLNPAIVTTSQWIMPETTIFLPDTNLLSHIYIGEQIVFDSITNLYRTTLQTHSQHLADNIKKANAETIYFVRSGDTLGHIAKRHNVTVKQIKAWNNLKSDFIRVGQRLRIKKN